MTFKKVFLWTVYKQNKGLCAFFCAFIFFTFYFNYKQIEVTPFFIWDMYSSVMQEKKQYKIVTVNYNNTVYNKPHTFNEPQYIPIYYSINHYRNIERNNMTDPMQEVFARVLPNNPFIVPYTNRLINTPENNRRYLKWLETYLQSLTSTPINNVTVFEKTVHFHTTGRVIEDSSKILYAIK